MSAIPIDLAHVQSILQNDAQQLRTFISWLEERNTSYQQNMTANNLTAVGITGNDQNAVLGFVADVARLTAYATGTPQGVAGDIRIDITGVLGVV